MAHKRPRPKGAAEDDLDDLEVADSSRSVLRGAGSSRGYAALTTEELFPPDDDDGDGDGGDGVDQDEVVTPSRLQRFLADDDDGLDDDDDEEPAKKKKKGKPKFTAVHTQPTNRGRPRPSHLVDTDAETHMMGPDPVEAAAHASVFGNAAVSATGLMEVPVRGFIETDIPPDDPDDSDGREDDDPPDRPVDGLSVEDICREYTESLRTHRMPVNVARGFTTWKCWYCRHRESMRPIPVAQRSTVMQAFAAVLDQYETETPEAQAGLLFQLWADMIFRPSIRGETEPIPEEDMMTVERFMICLRDHISPTERPMAVVSQVARQILMLLDLASDYWETTNTLEDEDGNVRHVTGLNHRAIGVYLAGGKLLATLMSSSSGGRFQRSGQGVQAATAVETDAIRSGLRLRAVRRPPPPSRRPN